MGVRAPDQMNNQNMNNQNNNNANAAQDNMTQQDAKKATMATAWWMFISLVLSLGAALAGLGEDDFEVLTVAAAKLSLLLPAEERSDRAYRVHPLTSWLARRLITVPWISLVNLVAETRVVDELTQGDVTPASLADAVAPLLQRDHPKTLLQRDGLRLVRERLGGGGAAGRVAGIAAELLG